MPHECKNLDDQELVIRTRNGDSRAFEEIWRRYYGLCFHTAVRVVSDRHAAADVVQDSLLRFWRAIVEGIFDPADKIKPYLLTIVGNQAVTHLRKKRPDLSFESIESGDPGEGGGSSYQFESGNPGAIAQLLREEENENVRSVLESLCPAYRAVLIAKYVDGSKFRELAEQLKVSTTTAWTVVQAAEREFKRRWNELVGPAPD